MLSFLFNRNGRFAAALEVLGVLGYLWLLFFGWFASSGTLTRAVFLIYLLCYLINRFISLYPWYGRGAGKDAGICLHFRKMYVAGAYFVFLTNLLLVAGAPSIVLYPALALFAVELHISFILLYFHWKDKDPRPPNFLTSH